MSKLKRKITEALTAFDGRITRFVQNLEVFDTKVPEGSTIAYASYAGRKLTVTYTTANQNER